MIPTLAGTLFDGETLAGRAAEFEISGGQLVSRTESIPLSVALADIRVSDRLGTVPRFLYFPDGRTLETRDNDVVDAFLTGQQRGRSVALVHWLESQARVAAAATLLLVATVTITVWWGMPIVARRLAMSVPPSIEGQAGRAALQTLDQFLPASNLGAREQARVKAQLDRLLTARPPGDRPQLVFRSMGGKSPNAFALPGGIIVMSDELVDLASDDELAAVLAHEIGHWQLRHGLQGVLRSSAALLVVSAVSGDLSTLTTFAGTIPFALLQNGYSREFEHEADEYALEALRRARISPVHFASILAKLESARPAAGRDLTYLSTHPATAERIKQINPAGILPAKKRAWTAVTDTVMYYNQAAVRAAKVANVGELLRGVAVPKPIKQSLPDYPPQLLGRNFEGQVEVEFQLDEKGRAKLPVVVRSDHPSFSEAALAAVARWEYSPREPGTRTAGPKLRTTLLFALDEPGAATGLAGGTRTVTSLNAGDTPPRPVLQPAPVYPAHLSANSKEGQVVISFIIDSEGKVRLPRVTRSTLVDFERPAVDAVRKWQFKPARRAGEPIAISVTQQVDFNLEEAPTQDGARPNQVH